MSDTTYRPPVNPWLIAVAVVVPTFMEVLDTTIANVALRYIAGGLSAAENDSEWVITSYLAANAIVLPISGWLASHLGRRNYFLLSITVFTLASGLCGMASSLEGLIAYRVIQGLAGGGLQPCSQGVLIDSFPPEKQNTAMTVFGFAVLVAPILGPTLGGYITDNYEWRWVFYINVPVGALAVAACYRVLEDPPYLAEERARLRTKPLNFDGIGLGLLAVAMVAWEVLLSKGQEWDWLGDPFGRIQTLLAGFLIATMLFVWRESRFANPVVNLRPLRDRNFVAACIIIFAAYGVLYGQTTSLPAMLQSLFGYDATTSGLVLSPAGFFAVMLLPVVGFLLGRGIDARWMVMCGLLLMAIGNYWLAMMNLEIAASQVIWPRVVLIVGLSIVFAPLNVAAYASIPKELRGAAVGLFSLLRNEGGSVGTSVAQTIRERRLQHHTLRLNEWLDSLNPNLADYWSASRQGIQRLTGDPVGAAEMAWQAIAETIHEQALSLAYFDVFWLFAVLGLALVPLVLLMKRSVAEKGAHLAAE
ncbi:MAG TPA: DHA2 family efflux MFS transporter permease subunit [Pirellulales bacterium]|nr:DHA2 family efflux MFS transporter permease subunit [Pirellulales bacterium]